MSENKEMTIDVTKIMEEIREDIEKRGLRDEVLSFEEIPMPQQVAAVDGGLGPFDRDDFMDSNMYMNRCYRIQTWHPIRSARILGFLIVFFKKIIRKMIRFFIDPIVNDQNDFNANTTRSMNQVRNYMKENTETVMKTSDDMNSLRLRMETVSREMEEMRALRLRVDELSEKVERLEEENQKLRGKAE